MGEHNEIRNNTMIKLAVFCKTLNANLYLKSFHDFICLWPLFNLVNTLREASFTVRTRAQSKTKTNIQINTIKYSNRDDQRKHAQLKDRKVVISDLKWVYGMSEFNLLVEDDSKCTEQKQRRHADLPSSVRIIGFLM